MRYFDKATGAMRKLSIIHLVPAMDLGGIEISTAKLARDQRRRGCDVGVVCVHGKGQIGKQLESAGVEVIALNLRTGLGMSNLIVPLWRICVRRKVDVLQVHELGVDIPVAIVSALSKIPKRILTVRAFAHYAGWRYWRARLEAKIAGFCFDKIVCISNALKDHEVNHLGRKPDEITVIWNGVDVAEFFPEALDEPSRARALGLDSIKADTFVVGVGAQLEKFKDIPTLMRTAARIKQQRANSVLFVVAGTGSLETQLKGLASQLEIADCFKFVGAVVDMPRFLNAVDVLALTSPFEGLGVIILEAMATGKPVVTTDSGGIRDCVTDGETGFIVPVGNDATLAEAILRLADNRGLANQMGAAGLARARRDFSLRKYTDAYWNLLTQLD